MAGNGTGLPDRLKSKIEDLSGMSLDQVRVHYNSGVPFQNGAAAFTQGTDIHLGPGQDRHLAHEAWHIVQQRQGRVSPTARSHIGLSSNDAVLEREASLLAMRTPL